jgi:8-oxo-dGTP pyrophosphatase MutT (NUDIX family)
VEWTVHGERVIYTSDWMSLGLVDVEIPGHDRFDHHVVRFPRPAAGTVIHVADRGVLLLWRHRFISNTWGWELPAGGADPGETLEQTAVRESIEEAGWRPEGLRELVTYQPINGAVDQTFTVFHATAAVEIGPPTDASESERIEWVRLDRLREEIRAGRVSDGMTLTGLLWFLNFEAVTP